MDITPLAPKGANLITGYGGGGFKINGEEMRGSLIVLPQHVLSWAVGEAVEINAESLLKPLREAVNASHEKAEIELLLIGSGTTIQPVSAALRAELKALGMAVEVMDTGAACRTYNVLFSEGRRVGAALIAV